MFSQMQSTNNQPELRRYPRLPLKLWAHYMFRLKKDPARVYASKSLTENLGTIGLAMRSDRPLEIGQVLTVALFLPPEKKGTGYKADEGYWDEEYLVTPILSRVVWCRWIDDSEKYRLGVQFLDLKSQDRHRLKAFLVAHHLDDPKSPLYT